MNDQISKLPKWAQERIRILEMQRNEAVKALNEFVEQQTVSPFSFEKHPCIGEGRGPSFKKAYIQTDSVCVSWNGVKLRVDAHDYGNTGSGIKLQWEAMNRGCGEVAMIPCSFQSVRLVSSENMRG